LKKVPRPVKKAKKVMNVGWTSYNSSVSDNKPNPLDDLQPQVKVLVKPSELEKLDLLWTIVLESTDDEVTEKAGDLLVRLHTSLDADMRDSLPEIVNGVVNKCIGLTKDPTASAGFITRVIKLIRKVISDTEKRGMNGVLPHNSILNGECLDRIIIQRD
jgi:hypothetical protein